MCLAERGEGLLVPPREGSSSALLGGTEGPQSPLRGQEWSGKQVLPAMLRPCPAWAAPAAPILRFPSRNSILRPSLGGSWGWAAAGDWAATRASRASR